ncbi:MAG: bifunctional enzyme CysN/CysC [Solirubrobacteraceae bacterium]|nr:bifunctional enzyme CysN/CysC [Solirubrobacteraceae bacterium]
MPGAAENGRLARATGGLGIPGADSDLLRLATAGSVDDGKSTLIGRLLYDAKALPDDQLEHIEATSLRRGDEYVDLALLTDGLRAEREQGITIDVAYRYFHTPRRKFIIADTPGHVQYTRNMITGTSTADLSVILLDARKGVVEQSRRHTFISSLLGVPHLVVCVNKMDLVDFDEAVFEHICDDFRAFAAKLEIQDVVFIPISALHGDNVVDRSEAMPWYEGVPLLYHLDHVHIASDRNLIDMRFPVQWVVRPMTRRHHDYRGYAGQVAGGVLRPGDDVVVLPSGRTSTIAGIDTFDGPLEAAFPPMSVTIRLQDDLDVSRGDMICRPHNQPAVVRELDATICWMGEAPLVAGASYVVKQTTRSVRAVVERLHYRIDMRTLHRDTQAPQLGLNDIGRVVLRTSTPLLIDDYRRSRVTGSFIVIDEATNETVGAGVLLHSAVHGSQAPVARNLTWHEGSVSRERRWAALGQRGATVWLTGLSGSGKSTIATALEERLIGAGRFAYVLDGDNLRHGLNRDLGFDDDSRAENVRRAGEVARLLADAGAVVLVGLISPFAADRELARRLHAGSGLEFLEVHVDTSLEACERRDSKGLYAKARRGEILGFTGISAPYEAPASPDLRLDGERTVAEAVDRLLTMLVERGVVSVE